MSENGELPSVTRNRQLLVDAQQAGWGATLGAFVRLSGPGWLQSAITLGGGSLGGALFLGVLGGTHMLWLQLMAILMGVIMLSAISYVTLSTGERPFQAINRHVNPVLGWGWLIATCLANMIWIMPQFSLSYDAVSKNLLPEMLDPEWGRWGISIVLCGLALVMVYLNLQGGAAVKIFDAILKAMIGLIVLCFFGVVATLVWQHGLPWENILAGFVPDLNQWNQPVGELSRWVGEAPQSTREFWTDRIVSQQRDVMIGAAATAVGINMTFLLPYSMLARGWDRPFRTLSLFDLATGMAIPYVLVTSCVVIASAYAFHGKADEAFLSSEPARVVESPLFSSAGDVLKARAQWEQGPEAWAEWSDDQKAAAVAALPEAEKRLASGLSKRSAFQLSQALEPLLGPWLARWVFGLGVLGMGFSTIIILMLINGYAFRELAPVGSANTAQWAGCLVAAASGLSWPVVWAVKNQEFWLSIVASTFGMMLLPVAYVAFFFLMNSSQLLGDDRPRGWRMWVWNGLMGASVAGAMVAAGSAIYQKTNHPVAGPVVVGMATIFAILVVFGFWLKPSTRPATGR